MAEQSADHDLTRQQIAQARAAEREACAKLVTEAMTWRFGLPVTGKQLAAMIRGMGQ